ncbi:hypothetical protein CHCC20442_4323 [Bacillus licheniformis]|nr:hypothetical protein CHCC20442_4323 [Bacillus licheniformis]
MFRPLLNDVRNLNEQFAVQFFSNISYSLLYLRLFESFASFNSSSIVCHVPCCQICLSCIELFEVFITKHHFPSKKLFVLVQNLLGLSRCNLFLLVALRCGGCCVAALPPFTVLPAPKCARLHPVLFGQRLHGDVCFLKLFSYLLPIYQLMSPPRLFRVVCIKKETATNLAISLSGGNHFILSIYLIFLRSTIQIRPYLYVPNLFGKAFQY